MKFGVALWLCLCWQMTCLVADGAHRRDECRASECAWERELLESSRAKSVGREYQDRTNSSVQDLRRLDIPGRNVDVAFKSPGFSGTEIALVRELQQDENIPALSKDFHPDHRPVSHHQLYVQSSCGSPSTRRAIGLPIEGHCRVGHTYYMASAAGNYILSSALAFSDPESVIQILISWTSFDERHELFRLSYNLEKDCQIHHIAPGSGNFVMSLPNYDCPWAAAVPCPSGKLIALLHRDASSPTDPYELNIEIIVAAHDYTPSIFKTKLNFYRVQFEAAVFYHWTEQNTFRVYGGSSAFEIVVDQGTANPIPFNRKARTLPRTSSCRVAGDGETVLILDRDDDFEPKEILNTRETPFGTSLI